MKYIKSHDINKIGVLLETRKRTLTQKDSERIGSVRSKFRNWSRNSPGKDEKRCRDRKYIS